MEAWLAGTPVIANAASAAVAWHCDRSGAGLTMTTPPSWSSALRRRGPDRGRLAVLGRQYVLDHYTWPATLDRMEASLEAMP